MRKRLVVITSISAIFMALSMGSAAADTWDSLPTLSSPIDGSSGCSPDVSISTLAVAGGLTKVRVTGSDNCTGTGETTITVCVLQQNATGNYEPVSCGFGVSATTASSSVEFVCVPGVTYKGAAYSTQRGGAARSKTTWYVTCPPL
ncbi:MAG TPA: hypothetical protein VIG64_07430 [Actinomycetota bacterium]|jgi:hypothetical protein